jgi:hypothetical protein
VKEKRLNIRIGPLTWEKVSIIIAGVLISASVIAILVSFNERLKSQGAYRQEYSGRVMDKWVTYHESEQGTGVSRHLLIKSNDGEVFQVSVSPDLYEQAKAGLWVIKDKTGIKILASEP